MVNNRQSYSLRHLRFVLPLYCALIGAGCAAPTREDGATSLLALNAAYDRALVDADSVALDSLYHPDFIYLGPGGELRARTAQIEALTSGRVDILEGRSDSLEIRTYGSTAIMLGRFSGRAQDGAERFAFRERYSTTWVREAGRWRLLLAHGTVMREPAPTAEPAP